MLNILHKTFMHIIEIGREFFCSRSSMRIGGHRFSEKPRVETVISKERGHLRGFLRYIVVSKLSEGKYFKPVVLLVIAEHAKVGF